MAGEEARDWGFRALDAPTAGRNFAEWISDSLRRDWFRSELAERGGPVPRSLDTSPGSLGPLGAFLLGELRAAIDSSDSHAVGLLGRLLGRRPVRRDAPPWARDGVPAPLDAVSDEGLKLIDETAWYLTTCYRARFPHSRCALDTDADSATFNEPLVIGPGEVVAAPVRMVLEALHPLLAAGRSDGKWLAELLDGWSARVPEEIREPPRGPEWAYRQLSRAEAKAHFARFTAAEAERLESFIGLVEKLGGPGRTDLDFSRDSLGPLGAWMLGAVVDGARDGEIPVWARSMPPYQLGWSGESIRLMDGLGTYFAAALHRRHPGLAWKLDTLKISSDYHVPVLGGLAPIRPMLVGLGRGRSAEPPDGDWILRLFDVWDASFGRHLDQDGDDLLAVDDVDVQPTDMDGFDVEIWIPDHVEQMIGAEAFATLDARIAALPGVKKLVWEDRELLYARLDGGTPLPDLRDRVQTILRAAAEELRKAEPQ